MKNVKKIIYSGWFFIAVLMWMSVLSAPVHANIYMYVDDNGIMHFTNAPTSPRYKLYMRGQNDVIEGGGLGNYYSSDKYDHYISVAAETYGVSFPLVKAVIKVESNFNPRAVSPKGAQGLMQIMPGTAKILKVYDPFDPWENIMGGTRYLRMLLDRFDGKLKLALAGYNAGPLNVEQYKGVPPFKETQDYVDRVIKYYRHMKNNS